MNDPKEIAAEIATRYVSGGTWSEVETAIAAALQAEREDGCRRVNDAIGDRDPIIETLKVELDQQSVRREEAEKQRNQLRCDVDKLKTELERVKAERDEAVKALEPFAEIKPDKVWKDHEMIHTKVNVGHCRAARAVVEKVKQ